jgi:hypothetical protein
MSLMKPMSSMRSASSSTRNSTCPSFSAVALHEVEQAAGGGDQDFDALHERADLAAHRHAADRQRRGEAHVAAIGVEAVEDLARQFAGRAQHQHAAGSWAAAGCGSRRAVQDRQREGRGLAGAGLGDADDVAAGSASGMVWAWMGVGVR